MKSKSPKNQITIAGLTMAEQEQLAEKAQKNFLDEMHKIATLTDKFGRPIKSTIVKSLVPNLKVVEGEPVGILIKVDFKARKRLS